MLMLYLLVPWTATNLIDFFFVRRGHYPILDLVKPNGIYGIWGSPRPDRLRCRVRREIPFMVLPPIAGLSYTGWIPNHVTNGVDYSWLVGLLVAGLVYWILSRSLDLTAEQAAIAASDRELAGHRRVQPEGRTARLSERAEAGMAATRPCICRRQLRQQLVRARC